MQKREEVAVPGQLSFLKPTDLLGISLACDGCDGRVVVPWRNPAPRALSIEKCPICERGRVSLIEMTGSEDPWRDLLKIFEVLTQWEERGISFILADKVAEGGAGDKKTAAVLTPRE